MAENDQKKSGFFSRRDFLSGGARVAGLLGLGGIFGILVERGQRNKMVWQIDPYKCVMCSRCATECVLDQSAVKCVQAFDMCGYCDLCPGYFEVRFNALTTAAENQLCPTGAIKRTFVEQPYFEYEIDEKLCIGCSKCVQGCAMFGNASFHLQIRHDRCLNCNDCSIARVCPSLAISRVPADKPYLMKSRKDQKA